MLEQISCPCHCSIQISNLGVKRGSHVILQDVSLTAHHGEILALIGRNGAGKTTLLKAI
ncbi:MAG: ATP-binding cassette domain-containing protein, partial [Akkermansia muciniphila]